MNAYVLCGGKSRRMGTDKAFLSIGGVPMAKRQADLLRRAGCSKVWLVGKKPDLAELGEEVLWDKSRTSHPLVGVSAALAHCDEEWALISPCDLPMLSLGAVHTLLSGPFPCVATDGSRRQPLLGIFPSHWAERANIMAIGQRAAMQFSEGCNSIILPPKALLNANQPSQLPRENR
jgi:molybdenum cofactor guanylyltransferase